MANSTIHKNFAMEVQTTSVLTYSVLLPEGIHFYTTTSTTADNPEQSSFAYIIFRRSSGITIFGMALGKSEMFVNASVNNGSTWNGWKQVALTS